MKEGFFWKVIGPVLTVDTASLICISTIQDDENYYSKLLNLVQENGKALFNTYKFYLACEECRAKKIASECVHNLHLLPAWLTVSKNQTVRSMYKQLGQTELLEQETMGVGHSINESAFQQNLVLQLFNKQETPFLRDNQIDLDPVCIYVSIDPSAGGKASDFAVCSAFYDRGTFVICGLEAIPSREDEDFAITQIVLHMKELRNIHRFRNTIIIVAIENNMGYVTKRIKKMVLENIYNVKILDKGDLDNTNRQLNKDPLTTGLQTTDLLKEKMYILTKQFIQMRNIRFYENFTVVYKRSKQNLTHEDDVRDILNELKQQWLSYAIIKKVPLDPTSGRVKITLSGKLAGKDDLIMGVQLNLVYSQIDMNRPIMVNG
jgi:hypothetical protein